MAHEHFRTILRPHAMAVIVAVFCASVSYWRFPCAAAGRTPTA